MLNRIKERFGAKVVAIGVATALLGGGVAMAALPEPAEQALAEVAAQIGLAEKANLGDTEVSLTTDAGTAQIDFLDNPAEHPIHDIDAVPQEVKDHFIAVMGYVSCIREHAPADADEDFTEAEKELACGTEPVNANPELEGEGEGKGRPAFLGEGEGRPAFLGAEGEGPPTFVGSPADVVRP